MSLSPGPHSNIKDGRFCRENVRIVIINGTNEDCNQLHVRLAFAIKGIQARVEFAPDELENLPIFRVLGFQVEGDWSNHVQTSLLRMKG